MKAVTLISGGIDSPVAAYLMLKKNVELIALHLDNRPFSDENTVNKVLSLIKHLEKMTNKKLKTYVVPHGKTQTEIAKNCNRKYQCVLCKRMMLRVAERVSEMENAGFIVTGESIGQVASQTLQNLKVISQAIKLPIVRPLIGFDKEDTIKIAREIGTFELSTQPGLCCTITPKKPSTASRLENIIKEENKLDIDSLLNDSLNDADIIT